jgi:hypothetical protein
LFDHAEQFVEDLPTGAPARRRSLPCIGKRPAQEDRMHRGVGHVPHARVAEENRRAPRDREIADEQRKLLGAYWANALPPELLKEKQDRISS